MTSKIDKLKHFHDDWMYQQVIEAIAVFINIELIQVK